MLKYYNFQVILRVWTIYLFYFVVINLSWVQEAQQDPDDDTELGGEVNKPVRWDNHLTDTVGQTGRLPTKNSMKFN